MSANRKLNIAGGLRSLLDRVGICLSALCIIHCLLTPAALILLPSLNLFVFEESFHRLAVMVILPVAILALLPGLLSHGRPAPILAGFVGAALVLTAVIELGHVHGSLAEITLSILGSVVLIFSHVLNLRFSILKRIN